jgi:hypothetical protein
MMQTPIVSYPTPIYQNLPIEPQFYQPSVFIISAIVLGLTTLVTTTTNMNYVIGQQVRLNIPSNYGCVQLNQQLSYVLALPLPNQVQLSLNSSINVSPFAMTPPPPGVGTSQPQIVAIGDINQGYVSITGSNIPLVTIPGSFINIS